jgi:membrane associated rhomboid family serine protease
MVVDRETMRFARAVLNRPYKLTIVLLVANFFVFLLMWQSSGMSSGALWEFPESVLLAYGAKLNSLINEQHQWWRFITPMFVHVNLPHVLVNMYSLWVVGPYVEKLYGSAKFIFFWVLTGAAGVLASYLTVRPTLAVSPIGRFVFKMNDVPSAGASGALFGLVGVLFVFGIKFRRELPEGFKRAFGTGMLPIILINLFIGYLGRGFIDNAAHLGGLVSGGILAVAVDYRRPGEKSGLAVTWQVLQISAIALVAVSFLKAAQHYKDPLPANVVAQSTQLVKNKSMDFLSYAKAMNDAQEAFVSAVQDKDTSNIDKTVKNLEAVPSLDPKADELKERLKQLLLRAKALASSATRAGQPADRDAQKQEHELSKAFVAWRKEYNTWLKTIGRNYGLIEVTETGPSPK